MLVAAVFIYPFLIQVATSFKTDPDAVAHPLSLVPNPFDLTAWKRIFGLTPDASVPMLRWLRQLRPRHRGRDRRPGSSSTAWPATRCRGCTFADAAFLFGAVLAVMAVPGVALLIPKFLIVTYLGIYDTYTAMILPLIVDAAGVFIMKQFFDSVPVSIEEAARMDGASVFRTFWSVVLPMARPALITLTILSFQGSWNEFSHFLVTTQSPEKRTLVTGLASLDQRPARQRHAVPAQARRGLAHHDPGGAVVLRLPAPLRPRRQRGRRQGLTAPLSRTAVPS